MTKKQSAKLEAIEKLRGWIKPGDTVYTILDNVSRSGMSRAIRVVVPYTRDDGTIDHLHPNYAVGTALDRKHWKRNGHEQDALVIGGAGMDMGFALVYELSEKLYGHLRCENPACGKPMSDAAREALYTDWNQTTRPSCEYCNLPLSGGYQCLGKGKCPSNYHVNHRDHVDCTGTEVYNPDGPNTGHRCYAPGPFSRHQVPDDWPRRTIEVDGETIQAGAASCIIYDKDEAIPEGADVITLKDGDRVQVCPTCHGAGSLPNPDGPQRFDLLHTDGYAVRHRWL
jgi:hypothetical protein